MSDNFLDLWVFGVVFVVYLALGFFSAHKDSCQNLGIAPSAKKLPNGATIGTIWQYQAQRKFSTRCDANRAMCGSPISSKLVKNFSDSQDKVVPATSFSQHLWIGDPRINIQNAMGKAKAYQVEQVLLAVDKLEQQKLEKQRNER